MYTKSMSHYIYLYIMCVYMYKMTYALAIYIGICIYTHTHTYILYITLFLLRLYQRTLQTLKVRIHFSSGYYYEHTITINAYVYYILLNRLSLEERC